MLVVLAQADDGDQTQQGRQRQSHRRLALPGCEMAAWLRATATHQRSIHVQRLRAMVRWAIRLASPVVATRPSSKVACWALSMWRRNMLPGLFRSAPAMPDAEADG